MNTQQAPPPPLLSQTPRESPSQVASIKLQRINGGTVHTSKAMLTRVSRALPGVEKRFALHHPKNPVLRLGDGMEVFGLQVSNIIYSYKPRRAYLVLYQFMISEITRLIPRYTAMVILIISTACPDWLRAVPAKTWMRSG